MSRTYNTAPWRLRPESERKRRKAFWTDNSDVRYYSRLHNRRDRHDARADLRRGSEPAPRQPRGRAIWDAW